jgi:hypothetical protein
VSHPTRGTRDRQTRALRTQLALADGLPFADVLTADHIDQALRQEKAAWRDCVWVPALTLWAFLAQVISPDGSCRAAAARARAWLAAHGRRPRTPKAGPYCKARRRLPESLRARLARQAGRAPRPAAPAGWLWRGRRAKLVGGTTAPVPDTRANQKAYPQPGARAEGVGFPAARLVVVFRLACGAVLGAALGSCRGKEAGGSALLRAPAGALGPGDVAAAERYFGGYFGLALRARRGAGAVVRPQRRRADSRRGRRPGRRGHVAVWPQPQRPRRMGEATYAALPGGLAVREVAVRVERPGFRARRPVVVTTPPGAPAFGARDLAALYRARRHAELGLRPPKVTPGMGVRRCQSPGVVRQGVWAHLLAYDLIRAAMARAAAGLGASPRDLSVKGALRAPAAFGTALLDAGAAAAAELYGRLLLARASYQVGGRPDRVGPRARKRRPKNYPHLRRPRREARTYRDAKT